MGCSSDEVEVCSGGEGGVDDDLLPARLRGDVEFMARSAELRERFYADLPGCPLIIPREFHSVSRRNIDPDALKVIFRLASSGHMAFLVGGGVRDLLLSKMPKDFDIATDATTNTVHRLFRNSRIIGRRFRLNHVYFQGGKIFEVSTFRDNSEQTSGDEGHGTEVPPADMDSAQPVLKPWRRGRAATEIVTRDNTYGNAQTDAFRRDLTINGLFYDPRTFAVIDYVGGVRDLEDSIVRVIGVPEERFVEDPVRMIRAIRHAARGSFRIEEPTYSAIERLAPKISACSRVRVYEEFLKEIRGGAAEASFLLMYSSGILKYLFPWFAKVMDENPTQVGTHLRTVLSKADNTIKKGHEIPVALVLLALVFGYLPDEVYADFDVDEARYLRVVWADERYVNQSSALSEVSASCDDLICTQFSHDSLPGVQPLPAQFLPVEFMPGESLPGESLSGESLPGQPLQVPGADPDEPQDVYRFASQRVELVRAMINQLFLSVGVYRADRERMERALLGRIALLEAASGMRSPSSVYGKAYFEDALQLVDIASPLGDGERVIKFWSDYLETLEVGTKPKKRRRRR